MLITLLALLGAAPRSEAADFVATTTGNWALGETWGNSGNNVAGSGYPTTGDAATINPGVTVTVAAVAACATLTVDGTLAANNAMTVSGDTLFSSTGSYTCGAATGTRTFTGNVTLAAGSSWTSASAGPCSFGGNLINNAATFTGNGTYTFTGVSKTISGATTTALTAATINGGSYTLDSSSVITISGALTFSGTTPTLLNNGALTFATTSGTGTLTQGANASITVTGANSPWGGTVTLAATASGNTVTYSGLSQNLKATTYHHLTVSGSGNLGQSWPTITVNGTCTLGGTVVVNNFSGTFGALVVSGSAVTANAAVVISGAGNLTVSGGFLFAQGGPLTVGGATTVSGGYLRLGNAATFTGDFTLSGGAYTNSANSAVTFGGNLTHSSGGYVFGTGINTLSGSDKSITGTIAITNVTVTGTYQVDALTVTSFLRLVSGGLTSANNLTLGNGATIIRTTGTLDAAPTFGTTVNVAYGGATAVTTGAEIPTGTTVLSVLTVTNTSVDGVTLGANLTANGASTVGAGAKLNIPTTMEIKNSLSINASGLVAVSNGGTLKNSGAATITSTAATLTFASGAKFQHAVTSTTGTVPTAGWNANATLEIMNTAQIGGTPPGGLGQSFGNVTWDNNQSSGCNLVGVNLNNIAGTFTVKNTGAFDLRLGSTQSPTENWGNLVLQGGALTTSSSTGVPILNVAGNVTFSGGTLTIVNAAPLNLGGDWTKSVGTFVPGTGTVTFNKSGPQTVSGSTTFNRVSVLNGAVLALAANQTAATLALNGVNKASGTWGATDSGASFINDAFFSGTAGILNITTGVLSSVMVTRHAGTGSTSTYGDALSFDVSVAGATPTGSITLKNDGVSGTTIGTGTLSGGSVTITLADIALSAGSYTNIVAVYGGDENFNSGNSSALTPAQTVTPKPLTISGVTASGKVYDGDTSAEIDAGGANISGGIVGSDDVGLVTTGAVGAFDTKNVGTDKTVTINNLTLDGATAGNYSVTAPTTTASITERTLTVSASGVDKTYDGTTNATVNLSDDRVSGDDVITAYAEAAFSSKVVGDDQAIGVSGISIAGGTDSGNYLLGNITASATANITVRTLTVTATGIDKPYDGNTDATVTLADNRVSGDDVVIAYTSAQFEDSGAGSDKPVHVSGISITGGDDATNYLLDNTTTATTANILANPLDVALDSSENPTGYSDEVTFTATLTPAEATGEVQFKTNNVAFGSPVTVVAGTAVSSATAALPRGTNIITAEFTGNGDYTGMFATNTLEQIVTNHPPVAVDVTYHRVKDTLLQIAIADLLTNVTDVVDGDTIVLQGVGAGTNGAIITTNSAYIFYTPGTGANSNDNDSFTYTVDDGYGGSGTANILVNVYNAAGPAQLSIPTNGVVNITFFGIPNDTYLVQTTTNLSVPWWPLSTNTAGLDGSWLFTDLNATNAQQYYRAAQP